MPAVAGTKGFQFGNRRAPRITLLLRSCQAEFIDRYINAILKPMVDASVLDAFERKEYETVLRMALPYAQAGNPDAQCTVALLYDAASASSETFWKRSGGCSKPLSRTAVSRGTTWERCMPCDTPSYSSVGVKHTGAG
jgi:hypothetical protein